MFGSDKHLLRDLEGELLRTASATMTLRAFVRRCCPEMAEPLVRAVRLSVDEGECPAGVQAVHGFSKATVRGRRVALMCGDLVLSEAENWYLPERLSSEMNRSLSETERPFGEVVRSLGFSRRVLRSGPGTGRFLFVLDAVLIRADGVPFSVVSERYCREGLTTLLRDQNPVCAER